MPRLSVAGRTLAVCAVGLLLTASLSAAAEAAGGDVAPESYGFVARLDFGTPVPSGDARSCTAVLVRPRVLVTAAECVATAAHPDPEAASALPVTARFRSGATLRVVDVRSAAAPGLALAVLARPAPVTPIALASGAATAGESVTAAGFGRTRSEWIPDQPHAVGLTVDQADATQLTLTAVADGLCKGDAGAPVIRAGAAAPELVAVATQAWQKGCLGSADTRGDVIARPVSTLPALPAATSDPYDQLTLGPADGGTAPVPAAGFGTAVATADFNSDGYPDVAVGAPGDRTGPQANVASGSVTVFAGGREGPATGKRLLQGSFNASDEAGDQFGATLATGDFNKDGYRDLAVGTPGEVVGTIKAGSIAVFNGSATGLAKARGIDQDDLGRTDGAGDEFGRALAAGDFNGDGYTDLAVGAPGKVIGGARSGQVTVLKGSSGGLVFGWLVDQSAAGGAANEAGDLFGAALAAGNVLGAKSGTVYADLVVGAPGESPGSDPQSGTIFVIPGSASGPVSGGVGVTQTGNGGVNESGDRFGASLAVGDFNKDGWADIALGIPGEAPGADPQSGTATVIPGGNTAVGKGYPLAQTDFGVANQAGDAYGSVVATGDVNGDGYADLIVGAPGRSGTAGTIYTYAGGVVSTSRPKSLTPGQVVRQPDVYGTDETGDRFGAALALADLNKDGKADAIVGSPGEGAPGEPNAGMVVTLSRTAGPA